MRIFLSRYGYLTILSLYMGALLTLHALGRFPRPGLYDLSHLVGSTVMTVEGEVEEAPVIRWGQTRFRIHATAWPMQAFRGHLVVTLPYPDPSLGPGDRIRIRGWLSRPPATTGDYWAGRRVYTFIKVWSSDSVMLLSRAHRGSLGHLAWTFQTRYRQFWEARLSWNEAALLSGMTVGARGLLPADLKETCIRAGVYHIVVVSGQNMSLLVSLGVMLLAMLAVPRRWALWISCPLIIFYTAAVGGDPPVTRAAASALVGLLVWALGRDVPDYMPLALAAGWILVQDPEALFGASFQLSFGATLSILLISPLWKSYKGNRVIRWLRESLYLGISVYVGIGPILVYYFHRLSLAGFAANWTIFPLSGVLMVLGLFLGSWGVISPESVPSGGLGITGTLLRAMMWMMETMAGWSWAVLSLPPPPGWGVALYYGGLFAILFYAHRRNSRTPIRTP